MSRRLDCVYAILTPLSRLLPLLLLSAVSFSCVGNDGLLRRYRSFKPQIIEEQLLCPRSDGEGFPACTRRPIRKNSTQLSLLRMAMTLQL